MATRERVTPGVRLALVLSGLAVLFTGVVLLTLWDARSMVERVEKDVEAQLTLQQDTFTDWKDQVTQERARQLAAPFLLGIETLEGVDEGTTPFELLQQRMNRFVYGRDEAPPVPTQPVGPLESVLIIDTEGRIAAATDPLVVGTIFRDPEEVALLEAALQRPQIRYPDEVERSDGKRVIDFAVGVPNSRGETIGIVRMRYVGGFISSAPEVPPISISASPSMWGPLLAGLVAILGVAFGFVATRQVMALTKRIEATAQGVRMPPLRGRGSEALSLIEEKLQTLTKEVRRDDLLVESLTEALREGVVLIDPEGAPVTSNRQAIELLRPDGDEGLTGGAFARLLQLNPDMARLVRRGLEERHAVRDKGLELRLTGGAKEAVQVTTYVLRDGDRTAGLLLVIKDLRSIESLERSLLEASKQQAIVRLTGSVAHEVKNPLGAIGIHLEHLRRRLARLEEADPAAVDRLEVLREEIARLREILDEWLGLTAPEERTPRYASVSEVLDSVSRLLRVEARHQNVDLVVDQEGELGQVDLSTARLKQVLLNLALNGLQAMPDGGRLVLGCRRVDRHVDLRVEDTGSGIDASLRDKVFDFHFTTREGGSGLGLPICRRLVENAGGTLELETEVGRGTTFTILLPLREAVRGGEEPRAMSAGGGRA